MDTLSLRRCWIDCGLTVSCELAYLDDLDGEVLNTRFIILMEKYCIEVY
jgi:hypothetical protein